MTQWMSVFPARAGMNRMRRAASGWIDGVPRTRGDEPSRATPVPTS